MAQSKLTVRFNDKLTKRRKYTKLLRGCTNLMYACQQGITTSIVSEIIKKVSKFMVLRYF